MNQELIIIEDGERIDYQTNKEQTNAESLKKSQFSLETNNCQTRMASEINNNHSLKLNIKRFDIKDLLKELQSKILDRSSAGIKNLTKIFKAMDRNGSGNLDVEDFRWGFIDLGFNLTQEEAKQLLEHFDKDKNGSVNFVEFLQAIKVSDYASYRFIG